MTMRSAAASVVDVAEVPPSRMFSSVVVTVAPSRMFSSEVVAVTPSRVFSSAVVTVAPSRIPISVEVRATKAVAVAEEAPANVSS